MAETWVLNESLDPVLQLPKNTIPFTSNGQAYAAISFRSKTLVYYTNPYSSSGTSAYAPRGAQGHWTNSAYRTVVFDSAPTGSLLSWLRTNGTKQVEPKPEAAKHICLIDGTGYSIKQGKVLIDGTAYGIMSGTTLKDGVGYKISFSHPVTVSLAYGEAAGGPSRYSGVEYLGTFYQAGITTSFEAEAGDEITITVTRWGNTSYNATYNKITVNGIEVTPDSNGNYILTLTDNTKITFSKNNDTYAVATVIVG